MGAQIQGRLTEREVDTAQGLLGTRMSRNLLTLQQFAMRSVADTPNREGGQGSGSFSEAEGADLWATAALREITREAEAESHWIPTLKKKLPHAATPRPAQK